MSAKKIALCGALAFFLIPLGLGAYKMRLFNIASIEILPMGGQGDASFSLIQKRISKRLDAFIGEPIWKAGVNKITSEVKKEKWVKDVQVSRRQVNQFRLIVKPRDIAALVKRKNGVFPVALDGSFLTPLKGDYPDAPFLSGKSLLKDPSLRQRAIGILEILPEEGFFSRKSISEIVYLNKKGFLVTVGGGGFEVLLGEKTTPEKVEQVAQVLTYVQSKGVDARVIDARLSKKVLVRLRNGP